MHQNVIGFGLLVLTACGGQPSQTMGQPSPSSAEWCQKMLISDDPDLQAEWKLWTAESLTGLVESETNMLDFYLDWASTKKLATDAVMRDDVINPVLCREVRNKIEEVLVAAVIKAEQKKQRLNDDQVIALANEEYDAFPENYMRDETRTVRHILLPAVASGDSAPYVGVEGANQLKKLIDAGERSFVGAAQTYSIDKGSNKSGGLLPAVTPQTRLVPAFKEVAMTLDEGVVSEPVQTQFGVHLVLVEKIDAAAPMTFEQALPTIRAKVQSEHEAYIAEKVRAEAYPDMDTFDVDELQKQAEVLLQEKGAQ